MQPHSSKWSLSIPAGLITLNPNELEQDKSLGSSLGMLMTKEQSKRPSTMPDLHIKSIQNL